MLQYYQNSAGTPDELAIEGSSDQVESEDEFSGDDESEGEGHNYYKLSISIMLLTWTFANSTPWQISISNYKLNCTASLYCLLFLLSAILLFCS